MDKRVICSTQSAGKAKDIGIRTLGFVFFFEFSDRQVGKGILRQQEQANKKIDEFHDEIN